MFDLARELGMTVGRMGDEMDSRELTYWQAYFVLENERTAKKEPNKPNPEDD